MPLLSDAKSVYVGTQPITTVMAGTQQVWPKALADSDMIYLNHCDEWNYNLQQIEDYRNDKFIKSVEAKRLLVDGGKFDRCFQSVEILEEGTSFPQKDWLIVNFTDNASALQYKSFTIDFWTRFADSPDISPGGFVSGFETIINIKDPHLNPDFIDYPINIGLLKIGINPSNYESSCQGVNGTVNTAAVMGEYPRDDWHHYAIYWEGNAKGYGWNAWLNGVSPAVGDFIGLYRGATEAPYLNNVTFCSSGDYGTRKHFDEIRITEGKKYTGNFTPPTKPYPLYE